MSHDPRLAGIAAAIRGWAKTDVALATSTKEGA